MSVAQITDSDIESTNNPLVTVYVTNFNYANYIEQSIESVLAQTYTNFELIIIDDGSTDNSREIINSFIENTNVRVIFQENKGLIASNNIAVRAAQGKYVMRLDADDYLDPNALLVLVNAIEKSNETALIFPDYYYVDADGEVTGQERRHDFNEGVTLLDQPAHGACTLIRRNCLLEVGGYSPEFTCQDGWDLWLKLTENYSVENVNLPLFYYRKHNTNLTNDTDRLLATRAEIYKNHAQRTNRPHLNVIAILPVRGPAIEADSQILSKLGDKTLIDWTIDAVLASAMVSELIITTPDHDVINYLASRYGNKLTIVNRDRNDSLENMSYAPAVKTAIESRKTSSFDVVLELTAESPFRKTSYIEKAINVMRVHDVDKVLGVLPDDSKLYRHTGSGLKKLGNDTNTLRYEREYLYRQSGGIMLSKRHCYLDSHDPETEKKGHIVLSKRAGILVRDSFERKVAELVLKENL
jgi:glycosyltransferase involved in cell wall biosynthesis